MDYSQKHTALDTQWHDRLLPLLHATGEIYAALELPASELAQRRKAFVASNFLANPDLLPIGLNIGDIRQTIEQLEALAQDITTNEANSVVRQAYLARISELVDQNNIKLAAAIHDAPAYDQANQRIYGDIDMDIFKAECAWINHDIASLNCPASQSLTGLLPQFDDAPVLTPSHETFTATKELHRQHYYQQLFPAGLPTLTTINASEGRKIAQGMMDTIGTNFKLVDSRNGLWAVMDSQQVVTAPIAYNLDNRIFLALMCHEIGSHLLEITNGKKQPLQLLQTGLDRYEAGNEGRAYLREQLFFDTPEDYVAMSSWSEEGTPLPSFEYRISLHLAIALSCGLARERWDFKRCYHLLVELQRLWRYKHKLSDNDRDCHNYAWHILTRALKGTDGTGGAYRKDIVYIEGNVHAWQVAAIDPQMILRGDLGKFDIANTSHITMLEALHIL